MPRHLHAWASLIFTILLVVGELGAHLPIYLPALALVLWLRHRRVV
jgi:hypothetical protein